MTTINNKKQLTMTFETGKQYQTYSRLDGGELIWYIEIIKRTKKFIIFNIYEKGTKEVKNYEPIKSKINIDHEGVEEIRYNSYKHYDKPYKSNSKSQYFNEVEEKTESRNISVFFSKEKREKIETLKKEILKAQKELKILEEEEEQYRKEKEQEDKENDLLLEEVCEELRTTALIQQKKSKESYEELVRKTERIDEQNRKNPKKSVPWKWG